MKLKGYAKRTLSFDMRTKISTDFSESRGSDDEKDF